MGFSREEIAMTIVAPFFMSTDMFRGVRTKVPLVSPDTVASRIVHAIRLNQEMVVAPWWSSWCYVVKQIIPYKVNERTLLIANSPLFNFAVSVSLKGGIVVAKAFGIDRAMDHFMGKQVHEINSI